MARRTYIRRPPPSGNPALDLWLTDVERVLNEFPNMSTSSTTNGPESLVTGSLGMLLVDVGSSVTRLWQKQTEGGTSGWSAISAI